MKLNYKIALGGLVVSVMLLVTFHLITRESSPRNEPTSTVQPVQERTTDVTEKEAIELVKAKYPELAEYVKAYEYSLYMGYIYALQIDQNWRVAFVQHGSGVNIGDMRGFEVGITSGEVKEMKLERTYDASTDLPITEFFALEEPLDFYNN